MVADQRAWGERRIRKRKGDSVTLSRKPVGFCIGFWLYRHLVIIVQRCDATRRVQRSLWTAPPAAKWKAEKQLQEVSVPSSVPISVPTPFPVTDSASVKVSFSFSIFIFTSISVSVSVLVKIIGLPFYTCWQHMCNTPYTSPFDPALSFSGPPSPTSPGCNRLSFAHPLEQYTQSNCKRNALKDDFHVFLSSCPHPLAQANANGHSVGPFRLEWSHGPNDARCNLVVLTAFTDILMLRLLRFWMKWFALHHPLFNFMPHFECCDKRSKLNWYLWLAICSGRSFPLNKLRYLA